MRTLIMAAAVATLLAGCQKEAARFGYRGADLADDDNMFFTTGSAVTNWVPARVLSVVEEYPMSEVEAALVKAAGVVEPCGSFEQIPEGYEKQSEEPWFVTWVRKDSENFGLKGVNGFIAHYDEDKKVWETGETYFSSYYADEAAALESLAKLRKEVAERFPPKKFHDFENCWIAEFLRMRIMCLVGQKADGTWSCMLDINDKCRQGCGQWEPVDAQSERREDYNYRKALATWKAAKSKAMTDNHAAVEKVRIERGLEAFGDDAARFDTPEGNIGYQRYGSCPVSAVSNRMELWKERVEVLSKATGVVFEGEPAVQEDPSGYVVWSASASSDIYNVSLDMVFPLAQEDATEKSPEEAAAQAARTQAEWRETCLEKTLPGFEAPPRPQPPQR